MSNYPCKECTKEKCWVSGRCSIESDCKEFIAFCEDTRVDRVVEKRYVITESMLQHVKKRYPGTITVQDAAIVVTRPELESKIIASGMSNGIVSPVIDPGMVDKVSKIISDEVKLCGMVVEAVDTLGKSEDVFVKPVGDNEC